jgi:hypothetical protein
MLFIGLYVSVTGTFAKLRLTKNENGWASGKRLQYPDTDLSTLFRLWTPAAASFRRSSLKKQNRVLILECE